MLDRVHDVEFAVGTRKHHDSHASAHQASATTWRVMVYASITGLARMRSHISSTWARAAASLAASITSRIDLPIRTSDTFVYPSAGSARSTVAPWGSSTPGRWVTSTCA